MYNSKPSSVSHKDGGDNSLIPAWSFLSLPWLLRLDLARNLMTLLAALSHSESCSCHSWPRGAIWDTPEPLTHVRTAFQIWSAQLLHPPPTLDKATGAVWFYFIFFPTSQVACSLHLLCGRAILHHSFAMKYTSWSNYVYWSFLYKGSKFSNLVARLF